MKMIILYYTYGGSSRKQAEKLKSDHKEAVVCEIKEEKKRNIFTAFLTGCPNAMKRRPSKIQNIKYDLKDFNNIKIVSPIWAGYPAPAFNAIVNLLPEGKEVELYMCSGGGEASKSEQGTKEMITGKGCTLVSYHNIKTS